MAGVALISNTCNGIKVPTALVFKCVIIQFSHFLRFTTQLAPSAPGLGRRRPRGQPEMCRRERAKQSHSQRVPSTAQGPHSGQPGPGPPATGCGAPRPGAPGARAHPRPARGRLPPAGTLTRRRAPKREAARRGAPWAPSHAGKVGRAGLGGVLREAGGAGPGRAFCPRRAAGGCRGPRALTLPPACHRPVSPDHGDEQPRRVFAFADSAPVLAGSRLRRHLGTGRPTGLKELGNVRLTFDHPPESPPIEEERCRHGSGDATNEAAELQITEVRDPITAWRRRA